MTFDLFARDGLPDEIALLRVRFPREIWADNKRLGPTARLWLERHAMFRALGAAIAEEAEAFAAGMVDEQRFMRWFAPRMRLYLGELHTHHAVEDYHYFPIFRAADPRLARGFEILDADHHAIDALVRDVAETAGALAAALTGGGDPARPAERLTRSIGKGVTGIGRHLDDEEDLVVPLILDTGEDGLGIG